ncbi:hypothetical protein C8A01DRAFT_34628 [Parachaetomium inaequale]|uniref:Uncharacterized protein n=1 Tax=Parachaetomium inaequale TaxID=2588326 RepID=A0AAN6PJX1_9PEZI|nr:hypothetical protein C8A01DRAFT_34628 [Parachaetomium inaequale]
MVVLPGGSPVGKRVQDRQDTTPPELTVSQTIAGSSTLQIAAAALDAGSPIPSAGDAGPTRRQPQIRSASGVPEVIVVDIEPPGAGNAAGPPTHNGVYPEPPRDPGYTMSATPIAMGGPSDPYTLDGSLRVGVVRHPYAHGYTMTPEPALRAPASMPPMQHGEFETYPAGQQQHSGMQRAPRVIPAYPAGPGLFPPPTSHQRHGANGAVDTGARPRAWGEFDDDDEVSVLNKETARKRRRNQPTKSLSALFTWGSKKR